MTDGVVISGILSGGMIITAAIIKLSPAKNGYGKLFHDLTDMFREEIGKPLRELMLIESRADQKHDAILKETGAMFNKLDDLNGKAVKIDVR